MRIIYCIISRALRINIWDYYFSSSVNNVQTQWILSNLFDCTWILIAAKTLYILQRFFKNPAKKHKNYQNQLTLMVMY